MTAGATTSACHLRWPCERFYWAILDASALPAGEKVTNERLQFMLEPELPLPLEEVHAVFAKVGGSGRQVIACALPREALHAEIPPGALTLSPSDAPAFVRDAVGADLDVARINLLVGEFEPGPVRAWRRRTLFAATAGIALALALVVAGLERRIASAEADAELLKSRRDALVEKTLGPPPPGQNLPPELRLAAELRALRLSRRQSETVALPVDATDRLCDLLACWPSDLPTKTESIVVSDGAVHVRGIVLESEQAQRLATATASLAGLQASFPSVQAAPEGCRFGLEWHARSGERR